MSIDFRSSNTAVGGQLHQLRPIRAVGPERTDRLTPPNPAAWLAHTTLDGPGRLWEVVAPRRCWTEPDPDASQTAGAGRLAGAATDETNGAEAGLHQRDAPPGGHDGALANTKIGRLVFWAAVQAAG